MSFTDFQFSTCGGHSADVRITLLVGGRSIPVAQLGPGMLLLDSPSECPPGEASIVFRVDGSERSWKVALPDGISAGSKRIAIAGARQELAPA